MKTTKLFSLLLAGALSFATHGAMAGAYVGADGNVPNLIAHPSNYTGGGGNVTVRVCISPASDNIAELIVPVQNVINTMNEQLPTTGNLLLGTANDVPSNAVDAESALLHETGHCIGLAHPNLATESGLPAAQRDYTKTTTGNNGSYDLNAGGDGVLGSQDDIRGDDVNLHWFRTLNNNPFTIAGMVDSFTYSRDVALLPGGSFVANAGRDVGALLGVPDTEAAMQQGQFFDEAQRTLGHDDVATLAYAASGIDEVLGSGDEYTFTLQYQGVTTSNCDITISVDDQTGFASCSLGLAFIGGNDHYRITSGEVRLNNATNWYYNQVSNEPPANVAPVLAPIGNQSVFENDLLDLLITASDDNAGDTLAFTAIDLPGFCTLTDNGNRTAHLVCAPQSGDSGNYSTTIFVNDDGSPIATDSETLAIDVLADNTVPLLVCSQPALAIPDGQPAGTSDTISVLQAGTISDLDVTLTVAHTYVGDLIFGLEKIGGSSTVLIDRPGVPASTFGCAEDDIDATIDDEGQDGSVEDTCDPAGPALAGSLTPESALAVFDGGASAGDWVLTVSDNEAQDTGTVAEWCLSARIVPDLSADSDGDGIADVNDNCIDVANADQRDTAGDGFGNICDADLNGDCVVNPVDLGILKGVFFTNDEDADLNGDGTVNPIDLGIFKALFFGSPGPSGIATCP